MLTRACVCTVTYVHVSNPPGVRRNNNVFKNEVKKEEEEDDNLRPLGGTTVLVPPARVFWTLTPSPQR